LIDGKREASEKKRELTLLYPSTSSQLTPHGLAQVAEFDTRDGVYDVAWSEASDGVVATAGGDGSVKLWAVNAPPQANPAASFSEHSREVSSLSWNVAQRKELLLSASWDDSVRLWDAASARPRPLAAFINAHARCCYGVSWNPRHADVFATCGGDGLLKIWDARRSPDAPPTLSVPVFSDPGMAMNGMNQQQQQMPAEALCLDWCKYNDALLAVGSVDRCLRLFDVRKGGGGGGMGGPLPHSSPVVASFHGHAYAVRRVAFSPHQETVLASASYDMTVRLWDAAAPGEPLLKIWNHHSEFAVGLDFSTLVRGRMASCGWDDAAFVWSVDGADPRAPALF
jgi:peroxin-7